MLVEELKKFPNKYPEMTQAHSTTQEHTGKLIENDISKALSKTQDTTVR